MTTVKVQIQRPSQPRTGWSPYFENCGSCIGPGMSERRQLALGVVGMTVAIFAFHAFAAWLHYRGSQ